MSTEAWFREFERQEAMREERLDIIRADIKARDEAAGSRDAEALALARRALTAIAQPVGAESSLEHAMRLAAETALLGIDAIMGKPR